MKRETVVLIVGAGPDGLATSACLNNESIPNIVLEKEDCVASLWKKKAYNRLKLHLPKNLCELPHMPFPPHMPTFVPKNAFIQYLDTYASTFKVQPMFDRVVLDACFEEGEGKWHVVVQNTITCIFETYVSKYLVVATGENSQGFIPDFTGLNKFSGEVMHSSEYEFGKSFSEKKCISCWLWKFWYGDRL